MISDKDVVKLLARYIPDDPSINDESLYQMALLHRSCASGAAYASASDSAASTSGSPGSPGSPEGGRPLKLPKHLVGKSYERLEFLGDAVLGLVTASYLYERYPAEDEGFMTRLRVRLVNGKMLADLCAKHTPLPSFVVGRRSDFGDDVVEDVFEAFLGALYLDRGYDAAHRWIVGFFEDNVDFAELVANQASVRAQLNRYYSKAHGYVPDARVVSLEGGQVRVQLTSPAGAVLASGVGPNRKDAEDHAMRTALAYVMPSQPPT